MPPRRLLLLLLAGLSAAASPASHLSITQLRRTVDLTSGVARTTTTLRALNTGAADAASVIFAVDATQRIAYVSFETTGPTGGPLPFVKADASASAAAAPPGYELYSVLAAVPAGETLELLAYVACVGTMPARPAAVAQGEPQRVEYMAQLYAPSPYEISGPQTTEFVLPTAATSIQYTNMAGSTALAGSTLSYGPFEAAPPWAAAETAGDGSMGVLRLNFENNAPFFNVGRLTRTVQISHWTGRLSVSDRYDPVTHTGALLKLGGGWSRLRHADASESSRPTGRRADGTIHTLSVQVPVSTQAIPTTT